MTAPAAVTGPELGRGGTVGSVASRTPGRRRRRGAPEAGGNVLDDDGADHDEVDEGVDGTDGRRRRRLGRRLLAGARGAAVAVAGLAGVGALGDAGLGGLDVVTGAAPASAVGDDGPRPAATPTEDPYLAGLTAEETPPPEGPDDRPPPVVDRPVLAPGAGPDPRAVDYDVPDLDEAWDAALPKGLVTMSVGEQYRLSPTVPGQSCNGDDGVDPVAGSGRGRRRTRTGWTS